MNLNRNIVVFIFFSFYQITMAQIVSDSIKSKQLQEVIITGTRTERSVATLPLPTQIISGKSII
jgi:outer membrane receptor for ferrienterochelin and colicins